MLNGIENAFSSFENINHLATYNYVLIDKYKVQALRQLKELREVLIIKNIMILLAQSNTLPTKNKPITVGDLFTVSLLNEELQKQVEEREKNKKEKELAKYKEIYDSIPKQFWKVYKIVDSSEVERMFNVSSSTILKWTKFAEGHKDHEFSDKV